MTTPQSADEDLVRQTLDSAMADAEVCVELEQGPCKLCRLALENDPRDALDRLMACVTSG